MGRGNFTEEEFDVALGHCTIDQVREAQLDVDPEIQDKVALWLIRELKKLRQGEGQIGNAPVLTGKTMSRLDIADLAMSMLESCEGSPAPNLVLLLQQLLDIDRHRDALSKFRSEKFDVAATIDAQLSLEGRALSALQLARRLCVSPTTITTWRRLPEYREKLEAGVSHFNHCLREFLDEIRVAEPSITEQQAYQHAFKLYKDDAAKRGNPDFFYWAKETLGFVEDTKRLKRIWRTEIAPYLDSLTPFDRKEMLVLFRKNKDRLSQ